MPGERSADIAIASTGNAVSCRACESADAQVFFEIPAAPVLCNVLCPTREAALAVPRAAIHLAYCRSCGLVFNAAFDEAAISYQAEYENALHFSPTFQRFAEQLVERLVERHDLFDKDLLEIGCGSGEFLAALCDRGRNRGLGFDPGHDPARAARATVGTMSVRSEPLAAQHTQTPVDFLCARHVLEHISRPVEFLRELRGRIDGGRRPRYYIEVPNVLYTLRDLGIWDIIYEHCSYFTPRSLARAVERAGFGCEEVLEVYDGQFVSIEGELTGTGRTAMIPGPTDEQIEDLTDRLSAHYRTKLAEWRERLRELSDQKGCAVVWGAGSKGVTFLNATEASCDTVPAIVDLNPRKRGKFVVGTGQPIIGPDDLASFDVSMVVVMNASYLQEIRTILLRLGVDAPLVVP